MKFHLMEIIVVFNVCEILRKNFFQLWLRFLSIFDST